MRSMGRVRVAQGTMRSLILDLTLTLPTPAAWVPSLSRGGKGHFPHARRISSEYQRADSFGIRAWVSKSTRTMPKRVP